MRSENRGSFDSHERRTRTVAALGVSDLKSAAKRIRGVLSPTPVQHIDLSSSSSNLRCNLAVKIETGLPTGSFKVRGALNFIARRADGDGAATEFVAASTGNHGLGLAWAAQKYGNKVTVVVPHATSQNKVTKLKDFGVNVVIAGDSLDQAILWARKSCLDAGATFVASFDPDVILGHATLGAELFSAPNYAPVVCFPIGIGSGISGIALARDLLAPDVKIVGVVPETCSSWIDSWNAGRPVRSAVGETAAQGLRTECPDRDLFTFLKSRLHAVVTVSEKQIEEAKAIIGVAAGTSVDATGVVGAAGAIKFAKTTGVDHIGTVLCG